MPTEPMDQSNLDQLDTEIAQTQREYSALSQELLETGASFIPGYDVLKNLKDGKYGDAAISALMEIPIAKVFKYAKRASLALKIAKRLESTRKKMVSLKAKRKSLERVKKTTKRARKIARAQNSPKTGVKKPCVSCQKRVDRANKRFKKLKPTSKQKHSLEDRSNEYRRASTYRKGKIAEEIGEEGMNKEARKRGYTYILPPQKAGSRPQGFDGVYKDKDGTLVVGEAKGGYNGRKPNDILGKGYNENQGTLEHTKKSCKAVLKSSKSNDDEKKAAQKVLDAIKRGKRNKKPGVRVELFHTEHKNGTPGVTKHYVLDKIP